VVTRLRFADGFAAHVAVSGMERGHGHDARRLLRGRAATGGLRGDGSARYIESSPSVQHDAQLGCLFFVSWLALLIAWVATRRSATGYLPASNAVAVRVQRRHAAMVRLAALGGVAWISIIPVAAIPALSPVANPLGLALGGAGLVALICSGVASIMEGAALGVQGRVVEDGFGARWVQLRGVHPAFSRALAARLGR
jgi:hypothetical protein